MLEPALKFQCMSYEFQNSFCMTWPYICIYNNFENFLWVSSVNEKKCKVIKLFRMPKETIDIKNTQITTSHELFILCRAVQWSV